MFSPDKIAEYIKNMEARLESLEAAITVINADLVQLGTDLAAGFDTVGNATSSCFSIIKADIDKLVVDLNLLKK